MNKKLKYALGVLLDVAIVVVFNAIALIFLRYDLASVYRTSWYYLAGGVVLCVAVHALFRLYEGIWSYASLLEGVKIIASGVILLFYNGIVAIVSKELSYEWAFIGAFLPYCLIFTIRFIPRARKALKVHMSKRSGRKQQRIMIVGGGFAGDALIRDLRVRNNVEMVPVCVLDDDENKLNFYLNGVKIVGKICEVERFAEEYAVDEIVIAIPSATKKEMSAIIDVCRKAKKKLKTMPSMYQIATGEVSLSDIKEVSIEDVLGRDQINVNINEIIGYIEGKVVLVTGGGGSIGSELCRQIAMHNPKQLVIVDIYENNTFEIEQELVESIPNLNLKALIASVRDANKIDKIFEQYRPNIVFHAAAHKHVPLMETSPNEAVKNNVFGTYNVASSAAKYGADKFILISTDKAVNPTNVMGATKRICEMIIQTFAKKHENTEFAAVRFGNVLGSNGSVIPHFKKQIKSGGPVTVTHKDIVRYFMTIPEAVSLVLQAGAYAKGGEIFVLDMGEPVRIYDLAEKLIMLSGFEPNVDIDIKITGLRPGEKLFEERLMAEEGLKTTENKMISIGKPLEIDEKFLFEKLDELKKEAYAETDEMKQLVHELVPTYKIDLRK